jgi:hypothetical protein
MIVVSHSEFKALVDAGLIKTRPMDKNFTVTSRQKKSSRKKHYVDETKSILDFLSKMYEIKE